MADCQPSFHLPFSGLSGTAKTEKLKTTFPKIPGTQGSRRVQSGKCRAKPAEVLLDLTLLFPLALQRRDLGAFWGGRGWDSGAFWLASITWGGKG